MVEGAVAANHNATIRELGDGADDGWVVISIFTFYAITQVNIAILIYGDVVEGAIPPAEHDAFVGGWRGRGCRYCHRA